MGYARNTRIFSGLILSPFARLNGVLTPEERREIRESYRRWAAVAAVAMAFFCTYQIGGLLKWHPIGVAIGFSAGLFSSAFVCTLFAAHCRWRHRLSADILGEGF